MAVADFLALKVQTGTPQVQKYSGNTVTTVGNTFGTADDHTGLTASNLRGYVGVVKFGGSKTFLATVGHQIYRSTDGGSSWTSVLNFNTFAELPSNVLAKEGAKSGLWVLHIHGLATAICVITDGDGTNSKFYAVQTTNGTTWHAYGGFSCGIASAINFTDVVEWRDHLVCHVSGGRNASYVTAIWSPEALTMTFAKDAIAAYQPTASLCVFQDRLFSLEQVFVGGVYVRECVNGVWTASVTLESTNVDNDNQDNKTTMFTDGTNLYCLYNKFNTGIKCYKLNTSLSATDITSTVMISPLTNTAAGAKIQSLSDNKTTPGSTPVWALFYATDGATGTSYQIFTWNGPSSAVTSVGSGGSAAHAMPFVNHAQGSTYWSSGENYIEIQSFIATTSGFTVKYIAYSDSGSATVSIRGWYDPTPNEYPLASASLTGTTTGITADNSTVRSITWNAGSDGVTAGKRIRFVLEAY